MKFQLVATCLFGLEHLLGEEIDALGYRRIETIDGRVYFEGDEQAVALANVFCAMPSVCIFCLVDLKPKASMSFLSIRALCRGKTG